MRLTRLRTLTPFFVSIAAILTVHQPAALGDTKPHIVDLIPLIDAGSDPVSGKWKLDHGAIVSDGSALSRLKIPYSPPAEYDFYIEFIRRSGNADVVQMIRDAGHSCAWQMGAYGNSVFGFSNIDGGDASVNATRLPGKMSLQNGIKYTSEIRVRKDSLTALLNGKIVSKYSKDSSHLSIWGGWSVGDALGIGSNGSPTEFSVIKVAEISGPGVLKPRTVEKATESKKDDSAIADSNVHTDPPLDAIARPGPTTQVASEQASVHLLEINQTDNGLVLGQSSELTLTVTRGESPHATAVRFVAPINNPTSSARDEAQRFIRLKYPNWNADGAEISFEKAYNGQDSGAIGAALGTMVESIIQGFAIDPDCAISGDIGANGKIRAIGGVAARLRGAVEGKRIIVAIPSENYDQLADAVVYGGIDTVVNLQVIGVSQLDDAVATVRTDRNADLKEAITRFSAVQETLKASPNSLRQKSVTDKLMEVLSFAPQHLSARLLLAIAQGKQPKTLSPNASRYYTFLSGRCMLDVLKQTQDTAATTQVPSATLRAALVDLRKLRPITDPKVRPLVDAWVRFIQAWDGFQRNEGSAQSLENQRQALLDEMAREQADTSLMQKMLKEGM